MKKRRKTIIAGPLIKIVEYTPPMPHDNHMTRSARKKTTSAAQQALNHRTAQGRLEEKLATNFSSRDYFVTLTYRPDEEPATRRKANQDKAKFIRKMREVRNRRGQPFLWIMALENKHGDGRYHFHAVINAAGGEIDREEIVSLWSHGGVHIEQLFNSPHDAGEDFNTWIQLARYMTKERPEDGPDTTPNGAQLYSCSRNLKRPIVITEWISSDDLVEIPPEAVGVEKTEATNEFSTFRYYKFLTRPIKDINYPN